MLSNLRLRKKGDCDTFWTVTRVLRFGALWVTNLALEATLKDRDANAAGAALFEGALQRVLQASGYTTARP
jgi:hypothetical protein